MLFYKTNKKRIFLAFFISLMLCFILVLISFKVKDIPLYSFPKGYTYLENENIDKVKEELEKKGVESYFISNLSIDKDNDPIANPYEVDYKVDISKLNYVKDSSNSLIVDTKNLLNHKNKVISYKLVYLNLPDNLVGDIKINIPLYNVEELLVGSFPKDGEVLIDESLANNLLSISKDQKYNDLLNKEYKIPLKDCEDFYCEKYSFKISGVYKSNNVSQEQNIIINSNNKAYDVLKGNEAILVKDSNLNDKILENGINLDSYNTLNYLFIRNLIVIIVGILIFTLFIYKDLKRWFFITSYYKVSYIKHLNILYLYIILLLIILLLTKI